MTGLRLVSLTRHRYSRRPEARAGRVRIWQSAGTSNWKSAAARRLLIVDDDRSLLSLLAVIFRSAGFEVATATDGAGALEAVDQGQPEAIILDLEMPGMNGRQFFRELRAAGVGTPVLILSAYNARAAQIELGAQAYTSKPFDPDDLIESVRNLLETHPTGSF